MQVDALVRRLADDLRPVRRRSVARDVLILGIAGAIEVAVFLWLGFMRHDMPAAMHKPSFWWKLGSMGLIALVGGAVALLSFSPTRSPRSGLRWLALMLALCLAAGWGIDVSRDGWPALAVRVNWHDGWQCVYKMVLLSVPALVGLGLLMRRDAPTDIGGTAWMVGVASAAWGAFVFVFACPHDDPLYIAIWYAVGCTLVTVVARLALPPLTRW
jgi:hypothetical protein